ncbi:WD repeat-containing protein RUP2 [Picochlorum sp. SENEW3]|nr:WD repeat-containing protein RUP2 [Picochlorum sp. SENEW3]
MCSSDSYDCLQKGCDSNQCGYCQRASIQASAPEQEDREGLMTSLRGDVWDWHSSRVVPDSFNGNFPRHVASGGSLDSRRCGFQEVLHTPPSTATDIECGLEFEEQGWLLASAGVSKQVRVYSAASILFENDARPIRVHRSASKLSSIAWNTGRRGLVSVGDYDGVVTEIDVESGHILFECDEHSGHRVWSVSYSRMEQGCMASASEDGTVAIWDHSKRVVTRIRVGDPSAKIPVTGVEISPWNSHMIGISSGDCNAYLYDTRNASRPVHVFRGHRRPASYARFLDRNTLVTAAIDSSVIAWNIEREEKEKVFHGHNNDKHFVGLSVRSEGGLISCGSENAEVFCYGMNRNDSVRMKPSRFEASSQNHFCSAVAWQPFQPGVPVLASAFSDGSLSVFTLD